jgi:hypothetical protein
MVEPEVAGQLGEDTELDASVHPPIVSKLHYEFDGWLGDVLVTSFPCYLVAEEARRSLLANRFTGLRFSNAEITTSEIFEQLQPDVDLPPFVWLRPNGQPGVDDFGLTARADLVVSDRALRVLEGLGIQNAIVEAYEPDGVSDPQNQRGR